MEGATTASAPEAPESRTCAKCGETKVCTPNLWVWKNQGVGKHYRPYGQTCKLCNAKRQAAHDARKAELKKLTADAPAAAKKTAVKEATRLDVAKALTAGSKVLNEASLSVLARLLEYAEDPEHKLHQWALDKLADRILPKKLYEELGGQAAGVGLGEKRPQFTIQILPAQAQQPAGIVVDGHVLDAPPVVTALPAPGGEDKESPTT